MKGLIIKPKWADLILDGYKTIELRGSNTKIRGTIGIIKSGTSKIYGTIDLVDTIEINKDNFEDLKTRHLVNTDFSKLPYKKTYGWILSNLVRYDKPVPYEHKQGCVIWVNI